MCNYRWDRIFFASSAIGQLVTLLVCNYLKFQSINKRGPAADRWYDQRTEQPKPMCRICCNGIMRGTLVVGLVLWKYSQVLPPCLNRKRFKYYFYTTAAGWPNSGPLQSTRQAHIPRSTLLLLGQIPWRLLLFTFICAFGLDLRQVGRPGNNYTRKREDHQHLVNCNEGGRRKKKEPLVWKTYNLWSRCVFKVGGQFILERVFTKSFQEGGVGASKAVKTTLLYH